MEELKSNIEFTHHPFPPLDWIQYEKLKKIDQQKLHNNLEIYKKSLIKGFLKNNVKFKRIVEDRRYLFIIFLILSFIFMISYNLNKEISVLSMYFLLPVLIILLSLHLYLIVTGFNRTYKSVKQYLDNVCTNIHNAKYLADNEKSYKSYIDQEFYLHKRPKIKEHLSLIKDFKKNGIELIETYERSAVHTILGESLELNILHSKLKSTYTSNNCNCYWCQLNYTLSRNNIISELTGRDKIYFDIDKYKFDNLLDRIHLYSKIENENITEDNKMRYNTLIDFLKSIPNKIVAGYMLWFFIHLFMLVTNITREHYYYNETESFYPFEGQQAAYDFSEFIVFTLAPFAGAVIYYFWRKPNK